MLTAFLDGQRDYLLHKCAGLTGEQLARRAVPPSTLSLLGLLRHMAEIERSWFQRRVAGADVPWLYVRDDDNDADFNDLEPTQAEEAYACLLRERKLADAAVADIALDDTFVHTRWGEMSLRWVFHHMLVEYSVHNGHADLLRQCTDGATEPD
jgi:hypothetical protein